MDEWMEWDMYNCVFLLCYAAKDPATLDERRSGPTVVSFVGLNGLVYGKPCTDHMESRDDLEQMARSEGGLFMSRRWCSLTVDCSRWLQ